MSSSENDIIGSDHEDQRRKRRRIQSTFGVGKKIVVVSDSEKLAGIERRISPTTLDDIRSKITSFPALPLGRVIIGLFVVTWAINLGSPNDLRDPHSLYGGRKAWSTNHFLDYAVQSSEVFPDPIPFSRSNLAEVWRKGQQILSEGGHDNKSTSIFRGFEF